MKKVHKNKSIHMYGSTGIGGMFAQYYVCSTDQITSFAQFACTDYKNTKGLGYPYIGVKVMNAMLECFVSPQSENKDGITIPTLVFKTLHDRYFSKEYFDNYYRSLRCPKRLVEIDDIHNSYYFRSEEFCEHVYQWFCENE